MAWSRDIHRQLLDLLFNDGTYTPPTNIFVALSSTTPTDVGGNVTEPSTGAYARVSTAAADWAAAAAAAPSTKANGNVVNFAQATADWLAGVNLTHFALYSAITAGTFQGSGALGTAKPVLNGDTPSFAAGALVGKLGASTDSF
jgi:hypothetical protein